MTYHLSIHHQGVPVLTAELQREPDSQLRVVSALLDNAEGALTEHGTNAFRCLAIAEQIVGMALGVAVVDPFAERVQLLEKEIYRLRSEILARGEAL